MGFDTVANVLAEEEVDPLGLFLPEPSEIFWSALVIIILAVAFCKFFLPMVNEILDKRSAKIEGEISEAAKLKSEAEALHSQYVDEQKNAKIEAAQIKDDARAQAVKIVEDAHKQAESETTLLISNAKRTIASEKKAAETELLKSTSSIAMNIVQKMLNQGAENGERQSRMIDNALDGFERSFKGNAKKTSDKTASKLEPAKTERVSTRTRKRVEA
jgi:F-type H+-transporting ATPase subunit b